MRAEMCGEVDYDESGEGPTLVLVPGSCSTSAAWRPMIAAWQGKFRCVTTSLLGYGGTAERRTMWDANIAHEADAVEAVVRRTGGPVHLVGHSYGGLVALATALRRRVPLRGLVIIEAPIPELLLHMGERGHYRAFRDMTDRYFGAFLAGDREAIGPMIDFYGGAGCFAAWPQRLRGYAIETTPVNILDWMGAYGFRPTSALLAGVDVPTLVLYGGNSHPAVQRGNELLGLCMPNAVAAAIGGAGHFMIATHAAELARVIGRHVRHGMQPNPDLVTTRITLRYERG